MAGVTLPPYLNLHRHGKTGDSDPEIRSVEACLDPADRPDGWFAAGIHSKDAGKFEPCDFYRLWDDPRCLAVGECGLDTRAETDAAAQKSCFLRQLEEAEKRSLPVLLHAVRAHDEIRRLKRAVPASAPWIVHGFRGNEKRAFELIDAGFYLSFGAGLLRDAGNVEPYFARLPAGRIFFETDESGEDIKKIYALAASFLAIGVPELREQVRRNFIEVFHHDL